MDDVILSTKIFGYSFPGTSEVVEFRGKARHDRDLAMAKIETIFEASSRPWIQLIVKEQFAPWPKVVAEFQNHGGRGWVCPMRAAGMA
jgi:hypothetical protein